MGRSAELAAELRTLLEQTKKATEAFVAEQRAKGYAAPTEPFELGYLQSGVRGIAERLEAREAGMLERRRAKLDA